MRYWVLPAAAAFAVGLALGSYLGAPEARPFFAVVAAAVGLLVGMSLEPIKHYFWLSQERWKFRFDAYSQLVAALWERESKLAATAARLPMNSEAFGRVIESIAAADDRAREAAAKAEILGDDVQPHFAEFNKAMLSNQQRARELVKQWQDERGALDPALAAANARRDSLWKSFQESKARFDGERSDDAYHKVRLIMLEYEKAAREHQQLVARLTSLTDQMRPETLRQADAYVAALKRLREGISSQARRTLR